MQVLAASIRAAPAGNSAAASGHSKTLGMRHCPGSTGWRTGCVSVINGHTSKVTATVAVGTSPQGIAAGPRTGLVCVTDQRDNRVPVLGS